MKESNPNDQPAWLQEVDRILAERRAAEDQSIRDRVILAALCQYGDEKHTPEEYQASVRLMCKNDFFYFLDNFGWTLDPRDEPSRQVKPFLRYDFQTNFAKWLIDHIFACMGTIYSRNLLAEKSRDMGVSWIVIFVAVWLMLFHNANILIGTKKEDDCDKLGDMSTMLEKARFIIRRLPFWLQPKGFDETKHLGFLLLKNPEGGQIAGDSANPQFGRGDRALLTILDEFSAWEHDRPAFKSVSQSSKVVLCVGTPLGPRGMFADLARGKAEEKVDKFRMHWTLHPIKAAGLINDADGRPTSPWYEEQKSKMSADNVASELDINYVDSAKGLVFSDYTEMHRAKLEPAEGAAIIRVWDPGLTFAVLFLQVDKYKRVLVLQELIMENARIHDVAQEVLRICNEEYPTHTFVDCGDPAGANRVSASQEDPEYTVLAEDYCIDVDYMFMQDMPTKLRVKNRVTAIHNKLREFCAQTKSLALLIDSDKCPRLDEALRENYRYKVSKYSGEVMPVIDEQHPYEDVVDCLGYGILFRLGLTTMAYSDAPLTAQKGAVTWRSHSPRLRR